MDLNKRINELSGLNQMYYQNYTMNNEIKDDQSQNSIYQNYQHSNLHNHAHDLLKNNNLNMNNFIHGGLISDKPWSRATKDPSIIQKGTELFVGNLSLETNEYDMYEVFRDCGEIVDIRVHKNCQNKKCYAFVRFLNKDMLRNALNKNLMSFKGRKMKVTKSNENSTIFIGNIRKNWTNQDVETKVKRIFPNCEKIEHFPDPNNIIKNRGFCFVVFKNRNEAIKALNYVSSKGGINIDGVPLTCDWADVVDEDDSNSKQIFVAGLGENVDENTLRQFFSAYGRIADIVTSKTHKSSKRKDLAFVSFETHEEAKNAVDSFKNQFGGERNYSETSSLVREDFNSDNFTKIALLQEKNTENLTSDLNCIEEINNIIIQSNQIVNPLGSNVNVSLAFSQQAMLAKKKIKESRKKVTPVHTSGNANSHTTHLNPSNSNAALLNSFNSQNNISNSNLNVLPNPNSQIQSGAQNLNAAAMLAMMNLINMNKNNLNINPTLITQMMAACFESLINQNLVQPSQLPSNNLNCLSNLNSLNNLNNLNPLNSSNHSNQILNSGANKLNNKRLKKINKKKRPISLNNTSHNLA